MCRRMGKEGHCQENRNQMNSELTGVTVITLGENTITS